MLYYVHNKGDVDGFKNQQTVEGFTEGGASTRIPEVFRSNRLVVDTRSHSTQYREFIHKYELRHKL